MFIRCTTCCLVVLVLPSVALTAEPLPEDHPIHQVPEWFGRYWKGRLAVTAQELTKWEFRLEKPRYVLGETIVGELTVRNTNTQDDHGIMMSPPGNGLHVSTLGLWVSRWEETDGGGRWGPLTMIYDVNKCHSLQRTRPHLFHGRAVKIPPGGEVVFRIPVNAVHTFWRGPMELPVLGWRSGIGFGKPGKYRFYLRYISLERVRRELYETGRSRRRLFDKKENALLYRTISTVLGPYEVEVVAPPKEVQSRLEALYAKWNDDTAHQNRCHGLRGAGIDPDAAKELIDDLSRMGDACQGIRRSLRLSLIEYEYSRASCAKGEARRYGLNRVDAEIVAFLRDVEAGPERDAAQLARCHVLRGLGYNERALKLAEELKTPDAQAFVDKYK
ncbi:hypothetical protein [uncultured Pseudodesulfovibrio sp.]|uniref:hypothetical protein n=1 Tax=uncultured Pseudodesulfovibrio sp. TaxID=2035858 RepID=UPI0029C7059E|nr:hypothetical protein [uncultured Pseudodesulfovibrio sp.]